VEWRENREKIQGNGGQGQVVSAASPAILHNISRS